MRRCSAQCPAQLPPTNSFQESADVGGMGDPARSASIAIRFRIALTGPARTSGCRSRTGSPGTCEERGLGLWLGDTRPGYWTGNWFLVHPHNRKLARATYRRDADQRRAATPPTAACPSRSSAPRGRARRIAILSFLGSTCRSACWPAR